MPDVANPHFSVIVCTHGRAQALSRCLDSLSRLETSDHEVLVVDNTDGDEAAERAAAEASARYLREPQGGLSRARNAGARASGGELLAYLDDDAIAEPGWLRAHAGAFADDSVAASTGRILPTGGSPSASATPPLLDLGPQPARVDALTPWWFERTNFGGLGFGGNMVIRRRLFEHGLRFRETLGAGATLGVAEETYALFTIIRQGEAVAYVPDAIVRHDEPVSATEREAREGRYRRGLAAYLALLIAEEPAYRRQTLRYVKDTVRRSPHPWRTAGHWTGDANRAQFARAAVGGTVLYLRSRFGRNGPPKA